MTGRARAATLELLLYAILDGYDDLIDDAEAEVERLQGDGPGMDHRIVATQLLNLRRRMMAVRGQLSGQREMFADMDGPSAIDPLWYAGALLAMISVVALAAVGSRRWL